MYSDDFLTELKIIFPNFPNSEHSGLGKSAVKKEKFEELCIRHNIVNLSKYKLNDVYWFGVEKEYRSQKTATCEENWGCKYPMQNSELFEKHEHSSYQAKDHAGMTGLRGYEPIVLDYFISKGWRPNVDVVNGTIPMSTHGWKFIGEKGNRLFPDFYIPIINTFVEVKSEYTLGKDLEKIRELPDIIDDVCGADYLVLLVKKDQLFSVDLPAGTSKPCIFENIHITRGPYDKKTTSKLH